ncbi:PfkB family carbohydrate kinase [Agromyces sp. NPDC004153]
MTTLAEVLAVGETMALVAPAAAEPLESAGDFRIDAGGAEANVASHLAALGRRAAWAGAVGDDALGRRLVRQVAGRGVDTSLVVTDPAAPTGVYFKDPGAGVHYYRRGSAASRLGPDFAAELGLDGVRVLHLSGITPALSPSCDALVDALVDAARAAGATVSFDVNHRAALWPSTDAAARRLRALAARADVVFVGRDEAEALWGAATAQEVRALLPEPAHLVVKDGAVGATEFHADRAEHVPALAVELVEAVGAGDAFAAGWLDAWLGGAPPAVRVRAGHERAVLVLADTADFPRPDSEPAAARRRNDVTLRNDAFDELLADRPLMAIFRGLGVERSLELARRAWDLGIDAVELPIQSDEDVEALAAVVAAGRAEGRHVGAGTVVTTRHVELAASAGAAFTVSPGFDPDVVRASIAAGLPPLPGVATASEVQAAMALGLTWLKAFPASLLGPAWFRAMAGPFPGARFVATGGMDATNAGAYLDAGVRTVAVGSALEDPEQLPALARLPGR